MSKYLNKLNKKLELIKFLHKPNTRKKCEDIGIKDRAFRDYNNEGDIEIGKVVIPFKIHENRNGYSLSNSKHVSGELKANDLLIRSSVHPIILPLNLTEVYLLTCGILDKIGRNHRDYAVYKDIADKIYSQLSDYGKQRIGAFGHDFIDLEKIEYISEKEQMENNPYYALYVSEKMMGSRIKITLIDDTFIIGKVRKISGITYIEKDNGDLVLFDNLGIKHIGEPY